MKEATIFKWHKQLIKKYQKNVAFFCRAVERNITTMQATYDIIPFSECFKEELVYILINITEVLKLFILSAQVDNTVKALE